MSKLSELEGVALGIVSRDGPCTPYAVRKFLKSSPSSHWQGSAGSVYPMLLRLEQRGQVQSEIDASDGRGRRLLQITAKGQKALAQWIHQGTTTELVSSISDHIRTRVFFIGSLSPKERLEFVEKSFAALNEFLATAEQRLRDTDRNTDPYAWFACENVVLQARVRVEWLAGFQKALGKLTKLDKRSTE